MTNPRTTPQNEQEWLTLDPRDWPHTPPLPILLAYLGADNNNAWRIEPGHIHNAFDQLVEVTEVISRLIDPMIESKVLGDSLQAQPHAPQGGRCHPLCLAVLVRRALNGDPLDEITLRNPSTT